jgi:hypothetical protein
MKFLDKQTLIDAAALGGGVIAGRTVASVGGKKVNELLKIDLESEKAKIVSNLLPIAGGIATLMLGKGNRIATGLANGMFASSAAFFVDLGLQKALGSKYTSKMGGVMMNGVMMNAVDTGENVLMGAAQDMPNYTSDSFDFTGADAGELDY